MEKTLPGRLLRSQSSEFGDRVYYVDKGRHHWIRDSEWLDVTFRTIIRTFRNRRGVRCRCVAISGAR